MDVNVERETFQSSPSWPILDSDPAYIERAQRKSRKIRARIAKVRAEHESRTVRGAKCPLSNLISTATTFACAQGGPQFVGYIEQPTLEHAGFSVSILVRFELKFHKFPI